MATAHNMVLRFHCKSIETYQGATIYQDVHNTDKYGFSFTHDGGFIDCTFDTIRKAKNAIQKMSGVRTPKQIRQDAAFEAAKRMWGVA